MLLALLTAVPLLLPAHQECSYTASRSATVPAAGAETLRLLARAGELRVVGRPGLTEVRVRGEACSSHERYLEGIQLVTAREGDAVRVEARMPEMRGIGSFQARLDLVVEVPAAMIADVEDSSGDLEIRNVAALRLVDSSGGVVVQDVAGGVDIDDNSGDVRLARIGSLRLSDSSGGVEVEGVNGGVVVEEDSSGDLDFRDVRGTVLVRRDSSGSIYASRVGGDFLVERDGSGGIRYDEVAGTVRIPPRGR